MTKKLKQENTLKKKITVYPNKFLPEIERYSKRLEHKGIQCFEINLDEIYSKERMSKVYKELGMKQPDSTHDVVKSLNGYLGEFELIDFIFMSMYPKENGSIKHTGLIGFRMITDNNEQLKHHLDELIYGYTGSAICNVSELKGSTDIYKTLTKMVWH
jgi:hypothetical protein